MIAKEITYQELEKAVKLSFEGDKHIVKLYDPNIPVETIDHVTSDILRKVRGYDKLIYVGVYDKNKLVGYFVRGGGMLVSFALCVQYRIRKFKREFYKLIKSSFEGTFTCFLWTKNERGIKWLQKCGMEIMESNHQLTSLVCRSQQ